ncbi:MAG: tetratricopeptide repeat protein [Candidatus Hydrogenedentales bacterium]|jgi:tetratricopeptide (TPR) repeat protein
MFKLSEEKKIEIAVCLFLVAGTLLVFGQVANFQFLNYDDDVYITNNPVVLQGPTWNGIVTVFTQPQNAGWNPMTTLTHMMDVKIFGLNPRFHHLINVFFHCANVALLFLFLRKATGALWPSVAVAALFAIHPLHVEPIAWVSSRKDVLSTHFFLMTLRFYLDYVERSRKRDYALAVWHFILALLSKPMVVTLPFILLLLDYWPLHRTSALAGSEADRTRSTRRLLLEKAPFFALSAAVCEITYWAQSMGGAVRSIDEYSWPQRLSNSVVSYVMYLAKTIWPTNLAPYYPHPDAYPVAWVAGALALLLLITAAVFMRRKSEPFLVIGWLWFAGSLLPVIGLIQIGSFARADRFAYLPHIGLFIAIVWSVDAFTRRLPARKAVLSTAAALVTVSFMALSFLQTTHWQNTITLWEHTLNVTQNNAVAHNNLGVTLLGRAPSWPEPERRNQDLTAAIEHLQAAVQIAPSYVDALNNLGVAMDNAGQRDEARKRFLEAVAVDPKFGDAYVNLGNMAVAENNLDEAFRQYDLAIAARPGDGRAYFNKGLALARLGKSEEASECFRQAAGLMPGNAVAHAKLASTLITRGLFDEAALEAQRAIDCDPNYFEGYYNLGLTHMYVNRLEEAIDAFGKSAECYPDHMLSHATMAALLMNQGRGEEAAHHFEETLRINPKHEAARRSLQMLKGSRRKHPATPATPTR